VSQYITEQWTVRKDDIYAAIAALEAALPYIADTPTNSVQFMRQKHDDLRSAMKAIDKLKQYPKEPASE
jgi:hypothetical protein